jgi:acyl-CoA synthetase (NDP forming)/GNAT superfamily N-acetyltransferase
VAVAEPLGWEGDVVLKDGGTVHVRPIRPDDGPRLEALHGRLSTESIYLRFFTMRPKLSAREVEHFTHVDHETRFALVALLGDDLVAVVRYDGWPGRTDAEVALVVDDAHQGRGIGTVLLEHLAAAARERGITEFRANVLPSNRRMLSVFRSAGFQTTRQLADGVVDVTLELTPDERGLAVIEARERQAEAASVARLLAPRAVAVVGAEDGLAGALVRALVAGGYRGSVHPVAPGAAAVSGVPAVARVVDVPGDVDLALVAVPVDEVEAVVEDCARRRVRGLVVLSPAPGGDGPALVARAHANGMRVLGPRSIGVLNPEEGVRLHAALAPAPAPGAVGVATQSAAVGLALLDRAAALGVGLSTFADTGEKADVSGNDLLQFFESHEATRAVVLYLESFGNPRKFARIARRVSAAKPVAALVRAPDEPVVDALFRQTGVVRVDTVDELLDVGRLAVGVPLPAGRRVAVVGAAGATRLVATACRAAGLELAPPPVEVPLGAPSGAYEPVLAEAVGGPTDAVLVVAPPDGPGPAVAALAARLAADADRPVLTALQPDGPGAAPTFAAPDRAARALGRLAAYAEWCRRPQGTEPALDVDHDGARAVVEAALGDRATAALDPAGTADLLRCYGVRVARAEVVVSADEARAAAARLDTPVTLKAGGLERGRTEAAGVALDLQGPDEVAAAFVRMSRSLEDRLIPAFVQEMVPAGADLLVGVEQHHTFGPLVALGVGGASADASGVPGRRVLPLTDLDAAELARSDGVRGLLFGADGSPRVDVASLEEVLLRVARLAEEVPELDALRANPVIVSPSGAVVVDATARLARAEVRKQALRRL